jgi:hypothetical protein
MNMPEVYTCKCGGQYWTIHNSGRIECKSCGAEYDFGKGDELAADEFNGERERYKV